MKLPTPHPCEKIQIQEFRYGARHTGGTPLVSPPFHSQAFPTGISEDDIPLIKRLFDFVRDIALFPISPYPVNCQALPWGISLYSVYKGDEGILGICWSWPGPKDFDGSSSSPPDDQFYASQYLFQFPTRKTTEITITKQTLAVS